MSDDTKKRRPSPKAETTQRDSGDQPTTKFSSEQKVALDHARHLAEHGVPIFVAKPDPRGVGHSKTGFWLPEGWQQREAEPSVVDAWRPGMALCAVMGHTVDGLDVDTQKDGEASRSQFSDPRSYGRQRTPSGGTHDLIAPLGVHSCDGLLPGIDVKAGDVDGAGRGFLFIAPTVKASKVTGEKVAYAWVTPPDLTAPGLLLDDASGDDLAALVRAKRAPAAEPVSGDGLAYEELDAGRKALASAEIDRRVSVWRDALTEAARHVDDPTWRDHAGRGWEGLSRDAAWVVAVWAATPWSWVGPGRAADLYASIMPEVIADDPVCSGKWSADLIEKARAQGCTLGEPPWGDFSPAVADVTAVHEQFPLLDLVALLDPDRPPRRWLWEGIVPEGDQASVVAPAGVGKSLLVLAFVVAVLRGELAFLGRAITVAQSARVLYIDMENSDDDWAERLTSLRVSQAEAAALVGTRFFPLSLPRLAGLDTERGAAELRTILDAYGIGAGHVVVLDSTQRVTEGDESANDTMRKLYSLTATELKRRGITVIRTDNTGWDTTRERGASAKRDDVGYSWLLKPEGGELFSLIPTKGRGAASSEPLSFRRSNDGELIFEPVLVPVKNKHAQLQQAARALDEAGLPLSASQKASADALAGLGFTRDTIREAVKLRKECENDFEAYLEAEDEND